MLLKSEESISSVSSDDEAEVLNSPKNQPFEPMERALFLDCMLLLVMGESLDSDQIYLIRDVFEYNLLTIFTHSRTGEEIYEITKNCMLNQNMVLLLQKDSCEHDHERRPSFKEIRHIKNSIRRLSRGILFEGQFKNNKREGVGIQIWPDGQKYIGAWKNDKKMGKGK